MSAQHHQKVQAYLNPDVIRREFAPTVPEGSGLEAATQAEYYDRALFVLGAVEDRLGTLGRIGVLREVALRERGKRAESSEPSTKDELLAALNDEPLELRFYNEAGRPWVDANKEQLVEEHGGTSVFTRALNSLYRMANHPHLGIADEDTPPSWEPIHEEGKVIGITVFSKRQFFEEVVSDRSGVVTGLKGFGVGSAWAVLRAAEMQAAGQQF